MSRRAKKRKNAGAGYGYMFHGAFNKKSDAEAKERKTKGAWIKGTLTNKGYRYMVMSPRTNPIKRKKKNQNSEHYEVVREFIGGTLKGLRHTEVTPVKFRVGQVVRKPIGGSPYKIISVRPVGHRSNPHELLVMGANPSEIDDHNTQEISLPPGATIVIRTPRQNPVRPTANPDRFTSLHARAAGAGYQAPGLIRTAKQRRVAGLVRVTRARAGKHKYDWIEDLGPGGTYENGVFHPWTRRPKSRQKKAIRRQNPDAAGIREDFTGMPVEWETTTTEPHIPAGDYAQLGELLVLYVKPNAGGQVREIQFNEPRPLLVSDETARQLYFVGGDQDLSDSLSTFGALDRGDGLFELGEARRIDYKQRKEHVKDPDVDEWRHELGEETGERPTVLFDRRHKRILFEGGAYEVRREGIVN